MGGGRPGRVAGVRVELSPKFVDFGLELSHLGLQLYDKFGQLDALRTAGSG